MEIRMISYSIFICVYLFYLDVVQTELFSATERLKQLAEYEEDLVRGVEVFLDGEEDRLEKQFQASKDGLAEIRRKFDEFKQISFAEGAVDEDDIEAVVGHPVNAYQIIKHWHLLDNVVPGASKSTAFKEAVAAKGVTLPTEADHLGSMKALLRLQRVFALDTDDLVKGNVHGFMAVTPMTMTDCLKIGRTALKHSKDYGFAVEWLGKAAESDDPSIRNSAYLELANTHKLIGDYVTATRTIEAAHKADPTDVTLENRMLILQQQEKSKIRDGLEVTTTYETWTRGLAEDKLKYEALCRGEDLGKAPGIKYAAYCRYRPGKVPINRYKEEVFALSPRIALFHDLISPREITRIREIALPMMYRASVGDPKASEVSDERVSQVAWLWDKNDPFIAMLGRRVGDCTGLDSTVKDIFSSAEPFQVLNYGIGGQYEPHHDYYPDVNMLKNLPSFLMGTGDRISTWMFYLTSIEAGGHTAFPDARLRVPPTKGGAAFWYNYKMNQEFEPRTLHAGCPVLLGQKWVMNKWIRQRGNEFNRPCGLKYNSIDTI